MIEALWRADVAVLRLLRTRGHWPPLEHAVVGFTRLGEHSAIWLAISAGGAAANRGKRDVYIRAMRTVVIAEVANAVAKLVFRRRRPELEDMPPLTATASNRSYPSAHATSSFAAARVLSRALPAGLVYAMAGAMALSRPYVGVHYPSDVIAGMLLGTVIAAATDGE